MQTLADTDEIGFVFSDAPDDRSWPISALYYRQQPAKSGRLGLPLAPLDTCMRRFDLSRPNPAVRRNPLAIDTLSANRVVSQRA